MYKRQGGWVTDSQGDWVWKPGKDDSQPPDLRGNWETRKWIGDSGDNLWAWQPGLESGQQPDWKPNKWVRLHDYFPWDPFYDSAWMYDYEG